MRDMFAGRFQEAEHFIERAGQFEPRGHGAMGALDDTTFRYVSLLQNWGLRRERGPLETIREPLERFVAEYPTFFIFRCLLANLCSQLGDAAGARGAGPPGRGRLRGTGGGHRVVLRGQPPGRGLRLPERGSARGGPV